MNKAYEQEIKTLSDVLDTVSGMVPKLIIGSFYKGLVDAGIPHEDALPGVLVHWRAYRASSPRW